MSVQRRERNIIRRTAKSGARSKLIPNWVPFASGISLAVMLCLTVNYRALSDVSRETIENERLNTEIREAMIENIALQEHIHYLKNDAETVQREVKKFGLVRSKE